MLMYQKSTFDHYYCISDILLLENFGELLRKVLFSCTYDGAEKYVTCECSENVDSSIHVILAWNEIGKSAIFGRETEVPDRVVFLRRKKKSILVANIVISSTVDHCKMFYLSVYGIVKQYCPLFCSFLVIVRG